MEAEIETGNASLVRFQGMRFVRAEARIPASTSKNHLLPINPEADLLIHRPLFPALSLSRKAFKPLRQSAICISLCLRRLPAMVLPLPIAHMLHDVHRFEADVSVLRRLS